MLWWMWVVAGFALLAFELATPGGFVLFFLGLSAILTGILVAVHILASDWTQWSFFGIVSVVLLFRFRDKAIRYLSRKGGDADVDGILGAIAIAETEISPDGVGQVQLRGAAWSARNEGPSKIGTGARCQVVRVDGLTLVVKHES